MKGVIKNSPTKRNFWRWKRLSLIIGASKDGEMEDIGKKWKETEEVQSRANE